MTYRVKTTDASGNPVAAELSFGVVDEAIYALKEDTPNALRDDFYPHRSNLVNTSFSFSVEYLGDADKSEPKITARKKFPDTAFWSPFVNTDASGKATVSFALPDNLTTWRATATVHSRDTRLGRATHKIIVSKPFLVRLQTPRFLTEKDQCEVVGFVHNDTPEPQIAHVHLTSENLTVNSIPEQSLSIAPGQIGQVKWNVVAAGFGASKLILKAWTNKSKDGSQFTDGLESTLPIRPHGREELQGFAGVLKTSHVENEVIRLSPTAVPNLSAMTIRLTPSVMSSLFGATEYLIGYPYGCTEQTMSRFLPNLLVQRAMKNHNLPPIKNSGEIPKMTQLGLQRLYRFQHESGAWGWWEHDKDDVWMTAYVMRGLAEAKNSGYSVSDEMMKKAVKAATAMAKDVQTDLNDRACLIYSLALNGELKIAAEERARPIALDRYRSEAVAYLALTDQLLKRQDAEVIAELYRRAISKGSTSYWKQADQSCWSWDDIGETAVCMQAIIATRSSASSGAVNPDSILSWLMSQRTGSYWMSTRDTSLVLTAFCDYLKLNSITSMNGEVNVKLNGTLFRTISLTPDLLKEQEISIRVPASALRPDKNDVTLERTNGVSPIFYSVQMKQTVASEDIASVAGDGVKVKREFLKLISKPSGRDTWTLQTEPTNNLMSSGDKIRVRLTIENQKDLDFVLIEDAFPSGCDISERGDSGEVVDWNYWWSSVDLRDDRIAFFARKLRKGTHTIEYNLRAQTPGSYHVMPTLVQAMYSPELRAETSETKVVIK